MTEDNIPQSPAGTDLFTEEQIKEMGFTPEEIAGMADGKLNPQLVNGSSEVAKVVAELAQQQFDNRIKAQAAIPQHLAAETQLDSLSAEQRAHVEAASKAMIERMTQLTEVSEEQVLPPNVSASQQAPRIVGVTEAVDAVDENKPNEDQELPNGGICPNCAWVQKQDVINVTEGDKQVFARSILGGRPFTKAYELFGGQARVEFRTRTIIESDGIADQVSAEVEDGRIPVQPSHIAITAYQSRLKQLQMVVSVVKLPRPAGPQPDQNKADPTNLVARQQALFGAMPEPLYGAIFKEFNRFEAECVRLMEASSSSDFW